MMGSIKESELPQSINQKAKNSKSYVIIDCGHKLPQELITPWSFTIYLRDEKETLIQLQPGFNIITIEDYPGLKYGFKSTAKELAYNCCITRIDLSHFDSKEVTDMSFMFFNMADLRFIDFTGFDTSNVENMSGAFCDCDLESLDLSSFNTSKVKVMAWMFINCDCPLDLSHFDMRNVKDVDWMLRTYPQKINISNWDLSPNVKGNIFGCEKLDNSAFLEMKNVSESTIEYLKRFFNEDDDEPENIITE